MLVPLTKSYGHYIVIYSASDTLKVALESHSVSFVLN